MVLLVLMFLDMVFWWEEAYILLVAAEVELTLLALVAKAGNVVGEVEARAFLGEDSRRECRRAGHV